MILFNSYLIIFIQIVCMKVCIVCNKEYNLQGKKYCSRTCYYDSRVGITRSFDFKQKNSISLNKFYKSDKWGDIKIKRGKKISKALSSPELTQDQINNLLSLLKYKYISPSNFKVLKLHIPDIKNQSSIISFYKKNPTILNFLNKQYLGFIPLVIQKWPPY